MLSYKHFEEYTISYIYYNINMFGALTKNTNIIIFAWDAVYASSLLVTFLCNNIYYIIKPHYERRRRRGRYFSDAVFCRHLVFRHGILCGGPVRVW